jgi:hypothetical protein
MSTGDLTVRTTASEPYFPRLRYACNLTNHELILFSNSLVVQLIDWFRDRESKRGSRSAEGVDEKYLAGSPSGQTEPYTQVHFCGCLAPSEMRVLKRLPGNHQPTDEISDSSRWPQGKLDGAVCGI